MEKTMAHAMEIGFRQGFLEIVSNIAVLDSLRNWVHEMDLTNILAITWGPLWYPFVKTGLSLRGTRISFW